MGKGVDNGKGAAIVATNHNGFSMTPDEATKRLSALNNDHEGAHIEADDILLEVLEANGFAGVASAYRNAEDRIGFLHA